MLILVLLLPMIVAAAQPEWVATAVTPEKSFTGGIEGPVCDAAGNVFAVSYQKEGTIGKLAPDGTLSLFTVVPNGGRANGLRIDSTGYLIAADYVNHIVHRINPKSGQFLENLTADWKGPQFRQPNDVGIAGDDTIYFTDPDWGSSTGGRIFMITPPPKRRTVLLDEGLNTPNGITVSPDDRRVYVGQSRPCNILVYDRQPGGTLRNRRVHIDFGANGIEKALPDGIRCDIKGNLYVSMVMLGKVLIVSPEGELNPRSIQSLGNSPANVTFCGPKRKLLYITEKEHGRLERVRTEFPGIR